MYIYFYRQKSVFLQVFFLLFLFLLMHAFEIRFSSSIRSHSGFLFHPRFFYFYNSIREMFHFLRRSVDLYCLVLLLNCCTSPYERRTDTILKCIPRLLSLPCNKLQFFPYCIFTPVTPVTLQYHGLQINCYIYYR